MEPAAVESTRVLIAWLVLAGAGLAFLIQVAVLMTPSRASPGAHRAAGGVAGPAPAGIADGSAEGGSSVWALIGSVLFILVAATAAGVIQSARATPQAGIQSPATGRAAA